MPMYGFYTKTGGRKVTEYSDLEMICQRLTHWVSFQNFSLCIKKEKIWVKMLKVQKEKYNGGCVCGGGAAIF